MLSVEQVHALEERVEKAVSYIGSLRTENAELRKELERTAAELGAAKAQNAELEAAAAAFKSDQARIESGIVHALEKLDMFEDLVMQTKPQDGAEQGAHSAPLPVKETAVPREESAGAAGSQPEAAPAASISESPAAAAPDSEAEAPEQEPAEPVQNAVLPNEAEAAKAEPKADGESSDEGELDIF